MRILILGRLDGWMGLHMSHFSDGFRMLGHEVAMIDYHSWDRRLFPLYSNKSKTRQRQKNQTDRLKAYLLQNKPDMVLIVTARLIYDLAELRASYPGIIVFYDLDGPDFEGYREDLQWIKEIDILLTVSKFSLRSLIDKGHSNVHYLCHGVNTDFYAPHFMTAKETEYFRAPVAFLGRPTSRRAEYLEAITSEGLVVWGAQWSKKPYVDNQKIKRCIRSQKNVGGMDVVKLYQSTGVFLNILREPFIGASTIMNLQVFSGTSTGTCLLTEWVEELPEVFEPDNEILTFTSLDDFTEKVKRYSRDLSAAGKIGSAGRKRCIAEHTHTHRASQIMQILKT